jgi:hypothetical protein
MPPNDEDADLTLPRSQDKVPGTGKLSWFRVLGQGARLTAG